MRFREHVPFVPDIHFEVEIRFGPSQTDLPST